jgi:AcrR family transcriptional regulator
MKPPPPLIPRKSPRQSRSVETVRAILEAAARILESGRVASYTTNEIAERAGVSIGSLYQYFPSKEALTRALILRETASLLHDADAATAAATGTDALLMLIGAAVRHQLKRPALARQLDIEEARLPMAGDAERVSEKLRAMLSAVLIRPDLPPQENPALAAADIVAMAKGMIDAAGERGEIDPIALERRVARAVFGYLAPNQQTL